MNNNLESPRAIVFFTGRTDRWWLCLLKPGFRHVSIAVEYPEGWILCDPLLNRCELRFSPHVTADAIRAWYGAHGYRSVETQILSQAPAYASVLRPLTCVETVKRVLGISAWWIFTPAQLHRHLSEQNRNKTSDTEQIKPEKSIEKKGTDNMGGIFSPPSPPSYQPAPMPDPQASQAEVDAKVAERDRQNRLEEIARRRRGRSGTVTTGWTGLSRLAIQNSGKTRLGE